MRPDGDEVGEVPVLRVSISMLVAMKGREGYGPWNSQLETFLCLDEDGEDAHDAARRKKHDEYP